MLLFDYIWFPPFPFIHLLLELVVAVVACQVVAGEGSQGRLGPVAFQVVTEEGSLLHRCSPLQPSLVV